MKRTGFTFIEILVAMVFLGLTLMGLFVMNQTSNRASMDAYYEFLAFSLAQEPIEIFRGQGYDWVENYRTGKITALADYPLDWKPITNTLFQPNKNPIDSGSFQRKIELTSLNGGGMKAIKMSVYVTPLTQTRVGAWLKGGGVKLEAIITERPHDE